MMSYAVSIILAVAMAGQARTAPAPKPDLRQTVERQAERIAELEKRVEELEKRLEALDRTVSSATPGGDIERAAREGRVVVGMTVAQVNKALKSEGCVVGGDGEDQEYLWHVESTRPVQNNSRIRNATEGYVVATVIATVRNGKVVSFERYKGEVQR